MTYDCNDWTNFWLGLTNTGTASVLSIESTLPGTTYLLLTNTELNTTNWGIFRTLVATSSVTWAYSFSSTNWSNMFFRAKVVWPTVDWSNQLAGGSGQWGGGVDASPALSTDGSTVYIASTGSYLYALSATDGTNISSNFLQTLGSGNEMTSSAAISSNGEVYIGSVKGGSLDGYLYSFTANLNYAWSNELGNLGAAGWVSVFASPAVTAGGAIYIGSSLFYESFFYGTGFFSFNTNSSENWFFPPPQADSVNWGNVTSSAAVGADGTVYFLAEDWRLYALYPNGNVKWFLPVPGNAEPDSSPAIAPDGSVVVGSCSPYLYSVNPDGSLRWVFHVPNSNSSATNGEVIYSSPVIDSNGTVYVGTGDAKSGYNKVQTLSTDPIFKERFTRSTMAN